MRAALLSAATPAGTISVAVSTDGVVRGAAFGAADAAAQLGAFELTEPGDFCAPVLDALARYAAGEVGALTAVPVAQPGGDFQGRAWAVMREIPPGAVATYAEVARLAGRPRAVRAAASACARNRIVLFVPCHRVVRSDGGAGGYAYGLERKQALLAHEARAVR